jgi:hypothetical protein
VHLGYEIADPEAGTFRSIYSAGELQDLSADRARRWAVQPPAVRPPRLSREDQYMSEALWHVQARNKAWTAGDFASAWHENRILEKYFQPALDTPSYVSRTGHRWSPEQRANAERRAAASLAGSAFVSHAQEAFPIFVWQKRVFWMAVVALVAAILGGRVLLARLLVSPAPLSGESIPSAP